ncbi:MAG: (deoxy)nucleoside triphosphate pyrophosphohydrolase [Ruminococcaceae bacterium]|nr:(deoxy)nucleoside triphosphate pyrophosphohydrolase [Oscillospiraceae bacterium]MBQ9913680.1 (deoxy)nucleoside triphosphate pyrophosphohydrolase [Clostridia bacterium]
MVQVAAALIRQGNRFMICQRPENKTRAFQWEFVGGKAEKGETREEALIRECREELGITVRVGEIFMEVDHRYPDINVHLTLFNAEIAEGTPELLEHKDMRWITPDEIKNYTFCPADKEILEKIIREYSK